MLKNNLEKLMDLTREVQELVEAGDWMAAAALESSRRPLVDAFLDAGPNAAEIAQAGKVFEKVISIDERMMQRIRTQRREAIGELRQEQGSGHAVKAYLANVATEPQI